MTILLDSQSPNQNFKALPSLFVYDFGFRQKAPWCHPSIHPRARPPHRYIGPLSHRIMRDRGSRFNLSRAGKKSEDAMSDGAERSVRMPEEWEWRWGYASLYWVGAPHCTAAETVDADAGAAGGIRTRRIQPRLSLNQQHAKMNMSF